MKKDKKKEIVSCAIYTRVSTDLFVSKDELLQILEGTGWRLKHIIDPDNPIYIAVIQKEKVAG